MGRISPNITISTVITGTTNTNAPAPKSSSATAEANALAEMFTIVKQIVAAQVSMVPFILAALVYWGFTMLAEFVLSRIEKHYSYYHD